MVIKCEEVWREVSNFIEGECQGSLRTSIEEHVRGCKRCTAVLEGARNVVQLYGDERMFEVPLGFGQRLQNRVGENIYGSRRGFLGWIVATAAAALVVGGFELGKSSASTPLELRSEHADPARGIPPQMAVIVSDFGKLFHVAGCSFIHQKERLRTMTARLALQEGYTPCVRCLKQYLS